MSNEHTSAEDNSAGRPTESGGTSAPEETTAGDLVEDAVVDDAVVDDVIVEDVALEELTADGIAADDAAGPAETDDSAVAAAEPDTLVPVEAAASDGDIPPQYGVGPFSIREVALAGVWLLAFIVSFFPIYGAIGAGPAVWSNGIDWVLTIGAPTVAVFLLVLRRLSPQGIRRVGSLGLDQFASVAFSVSSIVWLGILWSSFVSLATSGVFFATWVVWVELLLMLGGVVLTVVAPVLPVLGEDFRYRPESVAHRNARRIRPVVRRPVVVQAHPSTDAASSTQPDGAAQPNTVAPDGDVVSAGNGSDAGQPSPSQAFWALVPVERDIVDAGGAPLFRIGPTAWALVIEDRGTSFVVRHEDGRVGYLHDVSGVTRG